MIKFHRTYFVLAALLFITEALIALYLHDAWMRPYGGDYLVVILLYCIAKSFFNTPALPTAGYVLVVAYVIEISQYFHFINLIGLQNSHLARILLGTSFSFTDILMYTLGILTVIVMENFIRCLKNF